MAADTIFLAPAGPPTFQHTLAAPLKMGMLPLLSCPPADSFGSWPSPYAPQAISVWGWWPPWVRDGALHNAQHDAHTEEWPHGGIGTSPGSAVMWEPSFVIRTTPEHPPLCPTLIPFPAAPSSLVLKSLIFPCNRSHLTTHFIWKMEIVRIHLEFSQKRTIRELK